MYTTRRKNIPRRVCFRPGDDVVHPPPPDLVSNNQEFIRVGEMVLKKTQILKRQRYDTSWFRRVLYHDRSSLQNDDENDLFLDTETLKEFKRAILHRMDDEEESYDVRICTKGRNPKLNSSLQISSMINAILQSVNEVGWPKPDDAGPGAQHVSFSLLLSM